MYQQLILIGNLGMDPEMRYTSTGIPVTNFTLAVNKRRTNEEGQVQEKTTWFRVNLWRRSAEVASQYLTKGQRVMIIGEVDSARPYTDRDGNLRATLEVTANEFRFMESRSNGNGNGDHAMLNDASGVAEEQGDKADIPF
ncbi:MAG: single-stranded DNA-binding protein [Caldilineaceae bacterium]